MRLATVGIPSPLGLQGRVVVRRADPSGGASVLVDVTAAGELWWEKQGSGDPLTWSLATFPPDLSRLLRGGRRALAMTEEAVALAQGGSAPSGARLTWTEAEVVRLPLLRPPLLRDFYSFEAHVAAGAARRGEEVPAAWFRRPSYYKGNPATILPPGAVVPWPAFTDRLDYELEFACVLLSGGLDLDPPSACAAIAGYTLFCDFSARDIQAEEMRVRLGPAKSKDFASGLGPWLVTADEVGDPAELRAVVRLNGEEVGRGRLGDARWSFAEMVSYASGAEPLEPAEVMASGTVGGGSGQEAGRLLAAGDRIECELVGFGTLSHVVGARHQGGGALVAGPQGA